MTTPVIVGFALCVIVVVVVVSLWWAHDDDLRDHAERLAVIEAALNLGGEPLVLVDPPAGPGTDVDLSRFSFDPGGRRVSQADPR